MSIFGETFTQITEEMGETLYFNIDGELKSVKASLKFSTKAIFNLAQREYFMEGYCIDRFEDNNPIRSGMYFTRETQADKKYMVISIVGEYRSDKLCYIYCSETNTIINLFLPQNIEDNYGNPIITFSKYAENIPVFWNATVRGGKQMNDGTLDQTIYTMILPADNKISVGDRVSKKIFLNGSLSEVFYKIDSIDTSLMHIEEEKIYGTVYVQLSEDLRTDGRQKNSNIKI